MSTLVDKKTGPLLKNTIRTPLGILSVILLLLAGTASASAQTEDSELTAIRRQIERYEYRLAESSLEDYVERHPGHAEAWELLGAIRQARWDFAAAAAAYRKALDLGRENAPLLRGWIEAEGRSRSNISLVFRARRLKRSAERALELDPYHVETRAILAAYYYLLPGFLGGDKQRANRLVEELVELSPADGYYLMGERAKEEKKPDATILDHWVTTLQYNPQHSAALRALGKYWMDQDSTALALDYYRRAAAADPDDPTVYLSLGRVYRDKRVGMEEESAEQFRKALEIDPFLAPARMNLAEHYETVGEKQEAIREYQRLALNNPTYRARDVRRRLRRLIRPATAGDTIIGAFSSMPARLVR